MNQTNSETGNPTDNDAELERDLSVIGERDIVCHPSAAAAQHPGNRDYAVAMTEYLRQHMSNLDDPITRSEIGRHIVAQFRGQGCRFIGRTRQQTWKALSDDLARRWVEHHLRHFSETRRTLQQDQQLE